MKPTSVESHPDPAKLQTLITAAANAQPDCATYPIMELPAKRQKPELPPSRVAESPSAPSLETKLKVVAERAYAAGQQQQLRLDQLVYANSASTQQQPLCQQPRMLPLSPTNSAVGLFGSPASGARYTTIQFPTVDALSSIYLQQLLQQRPDARSWYADQL